MPFPRRSRPTIRDNTRTLRTASFGGIDISSSNDTISDLNTPGCLNMLPNNKGDLTTRLGIKIVHDYASDFGVILGAFNYKKGAIIINGQGAYDTTQSYTSSIVGSGYATEPFSAFEYNSKFYLLTRDRFMVYETGGSLVDVVGYIPTNTINTPETGGGTVLEELNMIQPKRAQEFQHVTGSTTVTLQIDDVKSTIEVYYRNATTGAWDLQTVTTNYTRNLVTGVITYVTFPPESINIDGNDAVRVVFEPNTPFVGFTDAATITDCTLSAIYGGKAAISAWFSGNPDYPNLDFNSGIHDGQSDPTYFTLTDYDEIGFDDQKIIAYQTQSDQLIIYKNNEDTGAESTWVRGTNIIGSEVVFYHKELNPYKGCLARGSVALINNSAWALSKDGYGKVVPKEVLAENSIIIQSDAINYNKNTNFSDIVGLLEAESAGTLFLDEYISIDFKGKLYISNPFTNVVWVCDYNNTILDQASGKYLPQWYILNNLGVRCWVVIDNQLHFGTLGATFSRFKTVDETLPYVDEQEGTNFFDPYPSEYDFYWTTKLTNLRTTQLRENVDDVYVTMQGYADTNINLWTRSDVDNNYVLKDNFEITSLVFSSLAFSSFVFGGSLFPKSFKSKVKVKDCEYFQAKIGGTTGLPATITNFEINVSEGKEI